MLIIVLITTGCNGNNRSEKQRKNDEKIIDDYSTKIDSLIQITNPRKFNGVILITQNGVTKYSKAFGYSNFKDKTPISLNDNFRIQSNSKQITATLILKQVESGNINLNNPIRGYLPELKSSWADTVTVHQLLNMSSGVVSFDKPLLFKSGTNFHYSNPAYGLLGRILKNVTRKKYADVSNSLFEELGMNNTSPYEIDKVNNRLINGYNQSEDQYNLVDFSSLGFTEESWTDFVPAGGIISNVKDLQIWDTKLHQGKILNNATYTLMTKSDINDFHEAFSKQKIMYGYGININENKPIKYFGHAGTGIGFVSLKIYVPEKDLSLIILENVFNSDMKINYHFEKKIRKIVLNSSLVNK